MMFWAVIARGERAKAFCEAPKWFRGYYSPHGLKICLLESKVDLDKTGASLCLVESMRQGKGHPCLPTLHY